ncbi:MAG: hypothetical protein EA385_00085 [Salinarimonadaceae bacterium]|nr:MAG: hypothetical protein EA385_00085 [Salinarimonadaceae bacterium]
MPFVEYDPDDRSEGGTPRPVPWDLRLGSIKGARQSLARLIRGHARGEIDAATLRTLTWAIGQLVGVWKVENDGAIEARIARLEAIAETVLKGGQP